MEKLLSDTLLMIRTKIAIKRHNLWHSVLAIPSLRPIFDTKTTRFVADIPDFLRYSIGKCLTRL